MQNFTILVDKIAQLGSQLEQQQRELDETSTTYAQERECAIDCITSLLGCHPHLTKPLEHLLTQLRQQSIKLNELKQYRPELKASLQYYQDSLRKLTPRIEQTLKLGAEQLKSSSLLPQQQKLSLTGFIAGQGNTILAQQEYLLTLVERYQQHFIDQPLAQHTADFNDTDYLAVKDELLERLQALHLSNEATWQLAAIRQQLKLPQGLLSLAQHYLQTINLVIKNDQEKSDQSYDFLNKLNEYLAITCQVLATSLNEEQTRQHSQTKNLQQLRSSLKAIHHTLKNQQNFTSLKREVHQHLEEMGSLIEQQCFSQAEERSLFARLHQLENKLQELNKQCLYYKQQSHRLKEKNLYDELTQLHNRHAFNTRMQHEYKSWCRYQTPFCLAFIDIDNFKQINDDFGHTAGDKALKAIAKALKTGLRDTDFICRYGGDEFVLILNNTTLAVCQKPLDKIREVISKIPFRFHETKVTITISIGVSCIQQDDTKETLLARSDNALYEAKKNGRNSIVIC